MKLTTTVYQLITLNYSTSHYTDWLTAFSTHRSHLPTLSNDTPFFTNLYFFLLRFQIKCLMFIHLDAPRNRGQQVKYEYISCFSILTVSVGFHRCVHFCNVSPLGRHFASKQMTLWCHSKLKYLSEGKKLS
ncbi:hypothetical protein T01_5923 [Trichinella spiralis]|uniref:Uncharacterized protein n=1 Tax=Trichinella spiralis TaxID=6334 RepID=A0A0V1BVD6_TRISP|nr:hypothetical protein T01_5923 [Trichinella spiralis]